MADGMLAGSRPAHAPPFCETHRAMIDIIARSPEGGPVARDVLSAVLAAAAAHRGAFSAPGSLRAKMLDGRVSVYLWPVEARALAGALPPPPPVARLGDRHALAAARQAMLARATECFALADALHGPDLTMQHRAQQIGERTLNDALAINLDDPQPEIAERALRLFGCGTAAGGAA